MKTFVPAIFLLLASVVSCAGKEMPNTAERVSVPAEKPPFERVHFPTSSDRVVPKDRARIAENARWMADNPEVVVVLAGHCDERGSDGYNMELGDRRARSVKAALLGGGADESQFTSVISHGERLPLDPRHNEDAWRKNRRVEFTVR